MKNKKWWKTKTANNYTEQEIIDMLSDESGFRYDRLVDKLFFPVAKENREQGVLTHRMMRIRKEHEILAEEKDIANIL